MPRERKRRNRWEPIEVRQWIRIGRDLAIVAMGVFMLFWQTVFVMTPNPLLVGAGLILLGLPPALRLDEMLRGDNDDETGFSHMDKPKT